MKFSYWLGYSFFKLTARSLFNYRVIGRERLDMDGGALAVCNHASFLDPPFAGIAFEDDIYYLARKSLMSNRVVAAVYRAWNTIPVDQDRPDMSSVKSVIRLLKDGKKVLVFPEGSRTEDGELLPGEPGCGLIVAKSGVPVIPMRLFGTREAWPRGSKTIQPAEITLVVGNTWHYNPAKYALLSGKELYQAISDDLMAEIASIQL